MTTPTAIRVIIPLVSSDAGITAGDAHGLAGITYRQLDHWARQGWVTPSIDPGVGRSGRRLYSVGDVIRLAVLRHLAISKVNTAIAGPAVAELEVPDGDVRVLWGPISGSSGDASFHIVHATDVLEAVESVGAWIVFDPNPIRQSAAGSIERQEESATFNVAAEGGA